MAALRVLRLPGTVRMRGPAPIFGASLAGQWTSNPQRQLSSAAAATSIQPETLVSETLPAQNNAQYGAPTDPKWAGSVLQHAVAATSPRLDWSKEEVAAIYHHPLMDLAYQAVRLAAM